MNFVFHQPKGYCTLIYLNNQINSQGIYYKLSTLVGAFI